MVFDIHWRRFLNHGLHFWSHTYWSTRKFKASQHFLSLFFHGCCGHWTFSNQQNDTCSNSTMQLSWDFNFAWQDIECVSSDGTVVIAANNKDTVGNNHSNKETVCQKEQCFCVKLCFEFQNTQRSFFKTPVKIGAYFVMCHCSLLFRMSLWKRKENALWQKHYNGSTMSHKVSFFFLWKQSMSH